MTSLRPALLLWVLCLWFCPPQASARPVVVGYFPEWAECEPASLSLSGLDILNLAFATPDAQGRLVYQGQPQRFQQLAQLKRKYPGLRLVISVGGWTGSRYFTVAARSDESRRRFAQSAATFVRQHRLDGLDLDWEYPGGGGLDPGHPQDRHNFTLLLREVRRQLGPRALLTAAVSPDRLDQLELNQVVAQLDWLGLMTYDMHQPQRTSHQAALYPDADRGVRACLRAGIPARKLLLGIPAYGYVWSGVKAGPGFGLDQTAAAPKSRSYRDILQGLAGQPPRWLRHWDARALVPWLYGEGEFVTYEDHESVRAKADYVRAQGLGGWMLWELSADSPDPQKSLLAVLGRTVREQVIKENPNHDQHHRR